MKHLAAKNFLVLAAGIFICLLLFPATAHATCDTESPATCHVVAAATTAYVAPTNFTPSAKKWLSVTNNCGVPIMVPHYSDAAWQSFYNNPQSCVSVCWVASGGSTFTASGTFTPACPTMPVRVLAVGGGGGGSYYYVNASPYPVVAYGGGGSGYVSGSNFVLAATSVAITVGSGGVSGTNSSTPGTAGTASSFGSYVTASGGAGAPQMGCGTGGSGGGVARSTSGNPSGGNAGTNGSNGNCGPTAIAGQGSPIVSSSTTVMGITFQSATFVAGGQGAQRDAYYQSSMHQYYNIAPGGIQINGNGGPTCSACGSGYGAGAGGATSASNGRQGFVYVEW